MSKILRTKEEALTYWGERLSDKLDKVADLQRVIDQMEEFGLDTSEADEMVSNLLDEACDIREKIEQIEAEGQGQQ